jgi:hypothetical protein
MWLGYSSAVHQFFVEPLPTFEAFAKPIVGPIAVPLG